LEKIKMIKNIDKRNIFPAEAQFAEAKFEKLLA
jgi:hypothetical protein